MSYRIDERVGCIAIIDDQVFSGPCLAGAPAGVVWKREGRHVTWVDRLLRCAGPDQVWIVPRSLRRAAKRELLRLERIGVMP